MDGGATEQSNFAPIALFSMRANVSWVEKKLLGSLEFLNVIGASLSLAAAALRGLDGIELE